MDRYEQMVGLWGRELPVILDKKSKEVVFIGSDKKIAGFLGGDEEEARTEKYFAVQLQAGNINNFALLFSPRDAKELLDGRMGSTSAIYALKPYYLNGRFKNAWLRMCEESPDDVRQAIDAIVLMEEKSKSSFTAKMYESLERLALMLHHDEKVPAAFLLS